MAIESRWAGAAILLASVGLASCGAAQGDDWNQFRGPRGDSIHDAPPLPSEWGAERHVAWRAKLSGAGWSQPVAAGKRIFLTLAETDEPTDRKQIDWSPGATGLKLLFGSPPPDVVYRWKVVCLESDSGRVLWERTAREGKPNVPIHPSNTYASETPVADGERVIAYFGMHGVYCYDVEGQLQWRLELPGLPMQFGWGTGSSLLLDGERVVIQCDNDSASFLLALDIRSGQELWRVAREERSNWATPYLWRHAERTELVAAGGGKMRSYAVDSGDLLWEMPASGRTSSSPVGDPQRLIVDSYDRLMGRSGICAAIRPGARGDLAPPPGAAEHSHVAWSFRLGGNRIASPLLYRDCFYVAEQSGILHCYDAASGKQHYRRRLPDAAGLAATPWASDGRVYVLDQNGLATALAAGPEFQILAANKLDDRFWASPGVVDGKLLLRGVDYLYCIAND